MPSCLTIEVLLVIEVFLTLSTWSECDWYTKIEAAVVVNVMRVVDTLNRGPL
jgi:hypothetical protein